MLALDQQQLLEEFSLQSDRLLDLGIIRTDSFTGEIGEYVACSHFGLNRTERGKRAVDAVDETGNRYQVKAKIVQDDRISCSIRGVDPGEIDYLAIVYFAPDYEPIRIVRIPSCHLSVDRINVSRSFLAKIEHLELASWEIKVPEGPLAAIKMFGDIYNALIKTRIVRSRRIVGDLGEFYACYHLGLRLCDNRNEKGADAVGADGTKYEIKTRRVYESGRRVSRSRRLNNIDGKSAEVLVVVVLDKSFRCAGMWTIPMSNVENPKSAFLQMVNTTPGVKNIVESRIDWLR